MKQYPDARYRVGEGRLTCHEMKLRAKRIRADGKKYLGSLSEMASNQLAHAIYSAEVGLSIRGARRRPDRIRLLLFVHDLLTVLDREFKKPYAVSDGENADGSYRHCRNGQFLRSLLASCRTPASCISLPIQPRLKEMVDAARSMQFKVESVNHNTTQRFPL